MKTNTARAMTLVPKQTKSKNTRLMDIRKEIRHEAKCITFISHLNAIVCFAAMCILSILDNFVEEFLVAMETTESVCTSIPATASAIAVTVLGLLMAVFSIIMYLFLNSSAQALRKQASELREE